ncbi:MAG: 5'-nucleotidase C-terminal domain-containing protein [Aeromicrobium sp.]
MSALPSCVTRRFATIMAGSVIAASALAASPAHAADDVTLNLIGINDFHGRIDGNTVKFAGTVEQIRQEGGADNSLLISAGDNVGASVFASAVQKDIPTIDVLNALALDASAAGNHEFDKGADDLTGRLTDAADFPFLAANVFQADGSRLLDPYTLVTIDGVSVAVVGALTEETPALVTPTGIAGLTFTDPTDAINDAVGELEALPSPPDVIVASIHEGAPDGARSFAESMAQSAVFAKIAQQTDAEVDAIFMGHTHQKYTYDAPIPGEPDRTRPIIQTGSYGSNVGNIVLKVDADTGDVKSYTQRNVARTTAADGTLTAMFARVAQVKTIVDTALAFAAEKGNEPVGKQTADITTAFTAAGARDDRASESTLGNRVADAQLAGVAGTAAGADLSVVNPGGLRSDLLFAGTGGSNTDGVITFAEANAVLPFTNNLSSVALTGAQLKTVFEQQWQRDANGNVPTRPYLQLGTSSNVAYTFDPTRAEGDRITSLRVDGADVDPTGTYKVAVPAFLAAGGDNFRAFSQGDAVDTGLLDYEVWIDYLGSNSPVSPDFARHTVRIEGLQDTYDAGGEVAFSLPKLDLSSLGSPENTSVSLSLVQGETSSSLGSFAVNDGSASPTFTLPQDASGSARLRVTASQSGTTALLPAFDISPQASIKVSGPSTVTEGRDLGLVVKVGGSEGKASGTVDVTSDGVDLGHSTVRKGHARVIVDTSSLSPGRHTLTMTYSGDDDYAAGEDTVEITVVAKGEK